ncbi:VOC family protein [Flavobacterium sp. GT3R68]|uniref:VOC family protein n=1 Tax=Flavobacterium sp. GT3R68 TaxID=2594437 RepID=UPI000F86E9C6|nr:VOC family protein [Flavobacterium sp. GT3R68]RTY93635.1 VOC family protein [Flavobacterium sp. GSN2]TRW91644.1 VOC family protein [Flavobacterium sp. GT3R68]
MNLRIARHTNNLEKIKSFYIDILGFELLGSFENHNNYDGIFVGKPNLDWHFEFTTSTEKANHHFDEDDILVLYPTEIKKYDELLRNLAINNIEVIASKNPYWNNNGKMFQDPDGYRIVISPLKINSEK